MKRFFTFRHFAVIVIVISIVASVSSCRSVVRLQSGSSWHIKTGEHPFSLHLTQQSGHKPVTIADGEASGLYFVTDSGPQYLLSRQKILHNNDTLFSAVYITGCITNHSSWRIRYPTCRNCRHGNFQNK